MWKKILLSVAVMCIAVPVAMADVNHQNNVDNVYTVDKTNITVDVKHPSFTIKVKSNPTTGYSWFLREYDANLIEPVKHSFQAPTEKAMGAPGFEIWTFKAKKSAFIVPQQTTLRLIYARPWQGAESATQIVFRISIVEK